MEVIFAMLEVREIRANPDRLRAAIRLRRVDPSKADVDRWLALDEQRRRLQAELDGVNAEKKQLASLGRSDPEAARQQGQALRERGHGLEEEIARYSQCAHAVGCASDLIEPGVTGEVFATGSVPGSSMAATAMSTTA